MNKSKKVSGWVNRERESEHSQERQSNGTKPISFQFVRSATMFFSSQAKGGRQPIDWSVIYLLSVSVCVCVLLGDSLRDRRWQMMKRNITLSRKWRSPGGGQESCFCTVNLRWEKSVTHRYQMYSTKGDMLENMGKKTEGMRQTLYLTEWRAAGENTATAAHRKKIKCAGIHDFIKGNDANWSNTSKGGREGEVSERHTVGLLYCQEKKTALRKSTGNTGIQMQKKDFYKVRWCNVAKYALHKKGEHGRFACKGENGQGH